MNELDLSLERPYSAHGRSLHLPPGYRRFSLRGVQFNWKREKSYHERRDLIPYAAFPFAAYGILVVGGVLLLLDTQLGLTFVAVGMLLLLALGIRNSWAIAHLRRLHPSWPTLA